jgi:Uma2 family endonuclease
MGMPVSTVPDLTRRWTAAEVRALRDALPPDDWTRYELIDGELLVMSSPAVVHQRAVFLLARVLDVYVRAERLGEVFVAPCDLELERDNLTQPDVFVVPDVLRRPGATWADVRDLLVSAEVLSPSAPFTLDLPSYFAEAHGEPPDVEPVARA